MRRRSRFNSTGFKIRIGALAIIAIFGGVFLIQLLDKGNDSGALSATEFKAGRIIDDSVFYNPNTMTAAEIDAFIDSHTSACDTWGTQKIGNTRFYGVQASNNTTRAEYMKYMRNAGYTQYHDAPFICVRDYYENPSTHKTNFETGGKVEPGMISAGQIIYNAAHEYNVNPQVLLVMLKKESYAWGDDWPLKFEYNTVMGYGCPDNAACDQDYFGFYNQVMTAAWQLNYYREHPNDYRYRPGRNVNIYYSPDYSCGTKSVYIENYATAGLYIYTPYTPNDAALANYPGTAWCGSYGNRNFYMYFREWFGSTLGVTLDKAKIDPGEYHITLANNFSLDWQLSDSSENASINLSERNNTSLDSFTLIKNSDDTYTIYTADMKYVLDVTSGILKPGTKIQLWPSNETLAQKWYVLDNGDGSYYFANAGNSNLVLAANASTSSLELQFMDSNNASQRIRLVTTEPAIANGVYRITSAKNNNYTLDISGANFNNNTNIQLWTQNTTKAQRFSLQYDSLSGFYRITDLSGKYSLDVHNAEAKDGANIKLWQLNNSYAQQWIITKNSEGSYSIISALSGKALDISGASFAKGTNIQTWQKNDTNAQKWHLISVPDSSRDIIDGTYSFSTNNSGKILDITENKLSLKDPTTNNNIPSFKVAFDESIGFYRISTGRTEKYLTATSSNTIEFTGISESPNQFWVIEKLGYDKIAIRSANSSKVLVEKASSLSLTEDSATTSKEWVFAEQQQEEELIDASKEYEIVSSINQNFALDVSGANFISGTNVQLYRRNQTPAQKFRFRPTENKNEYTILSSNSNYVLDVSGASTYSGANIQLWVSNGTCAQKWTAIVNQDNSYTFLNACSNKALDLSSASINNGSNIQIWEDNKTNAQKWILE